MDKVTVLGERSMDHYLLCKYGPPVEIGGLAKKSRSRLNIQFLNSSYPRPRDRCHESLDIADQTEEILNSAVPPKEWESEGIIWRQALSRDVATRLDALNLEHNLDALLKERQARESGICLVRNELYSHCFDEIIRQVTMNSPERGLLLLRMRDEIRMTLAAYRALYESAIAYGRQSADEGYHLKKEFMKHIDLLHCKAEASRKVVEKMRLEVDYTRRKLKEKREMDDKRFSEEVQFIKRANQQLKQETESLLEYQNTASSVELQ